MTTKETGMNPKDLMAQTKDRVGLVPPEGIRMIAKAMYYGAHKAPRKDGGYGYGEYNWRSIKVRYTVYLEATIRHALALLDREDLDPVSMEHHIGHIGANAVIMADALKHGCLVDDRPPAPNKEPAPTTKVEIAPSSISKSIEKLRGVLKIMHQYPESYACKKKHCKCVKSKEDK